MAGLPEHIEAQIREIVETDDLVLLEVARRGQINSTVIEVIVDGPQGVDLEKLADLSRAVSQILDNEEDAVRGRYRLEVSTPGLDRPLQHGWQFRKNLGRLVNLTYLDDEGKKATALFRLLDADDTGLKIEGVTKGKAGRKPKKNPLAEPMILPFERIERVVVEPEL